MNKTSNKIILSVICVVLALSVLFTVFILRGNGNGEAQADTLTAQEADESGTADESAASGADTDETVYVISGSDGTVKSVMLSNKLKEMLESGKESGKGAEQGKAQESDKDKKDDSSKSSGAADDISVLDIEGNELDCPADIGSELPVDISITYSLDGKRISADKLAGKSGRVRIRFDYKNNQYENRLISGKEETVYVPFAVITGMVLDNSSFTDIEVSNGKLLSDGEHTAVIGIAFPGMQQNLGVAENKLDIPDYVEVTADVKDFKLGMTVTAATDEVFDKLDASKLDSLDDIVSSMDDLKSGMQKLLDGSSDLSDGLGTLLDSSETLKAGIDALTDGSKEMKEGAVSLEAGAGQLKSGASALSSGLNTLKENNDSLNGGAEQVFKSLLSAAETQIREGGISVPDLTIRNYSKTLKGVIDSLDKDAVYDKALKQVTAAVEKKRSLITEKVTAAVYEQVEAKVTEQVEKQVTEGVTSAVREQVTEAVINAAAGMSKSDYDAAVSAGMIPKETQDAVNAAIENQMAAKETVALIDSNIASKMESDEILSTIKTNTDAQMKTDEIQKTVSDNTELQIEQAIADNMASDEVQSKLSAASEGAKKIIALKSSLDSYNAFYKGLQGYTSGVAEAADGAATLADGVRDLKDGASEIKTGAASVYEGLEKVDKKMPELVSGVKKLKSGSIQLSSGLAEFNRDGIQKIVDLVEGSAEKLIPRLKATAEVSDSYRSFADITDASDDNPIRFIYRTEEIGDK